MILTLFSSSSLIYYIPTTVSPPSSLACPFPTSSLLYPLLFRKGQVVQGSQPHLAYQVAKRLDASPQVKVEQGNPVGEKGFPKQAKWSQTAPCSHSWECHKNKKKLHNHSIYAESLSQTSVDSVIVSLVSVSPGEFWVIDSMGFLGPEMTLPLIVKLPSPHFTSS